MNRDTLRSPAFISFGVAFLLALLFAAYTNHVWEDYYITYRSSKNLATGHGLVYNIGDRLHTYTSPLGVLLPALSSLLTANSSDTGALWIFRCMSIAAFAGGATLMSGLVRRLQYPAVAVLFLGTMLILDAKSLDFTINGMETGFMLLFIGATLWAHLMPGPRQWQYLGAAWAGLMWTRPDSFIYIGLIGAGFWICHDPAHTGGNRRQLLLQYLRAALVTTALYGPWLLWAKWYYGSPIPHTIVAKAAQAGDQALPRVLAGCWRLPFWIWQGKTSVEGAFLPSYYSMPAWPDWVMPWSRILGTLASVAWILPGVRRETRVASFAFYGGLTYLSFVPYFPFPWYFPAPAWLGYLALAGLAAQGWERCGRAGVALKSAGRGFVGLAAGLAIVGAGWLAWGVARQVRAQQIYIEDGNRHVIGDWLKAHSRPGESVFMEPLGYIGYFSGLKTHDWPGMSSHELVEAKLIVGTNWGSLIRYLQPTWLVLRPDGVGDLPVFAPLLNTTNYEFVREFSQAEALKKISVPGQKLLEFDARFRVYHLKQPTRHDVDGLQIASPFPSSIRTIEGRQVRLVHAPGSMIADIPENAHHVAGQYGFPPEAYAGTTPTDGAKFQVFWSDDTRRIELYSRRLNPTVTAADRPLHEYRLELPAPRPGSRARLTFETDPDGNANQDWTCWSTPEFLH